jgi:ubiquinol-cytochrome c reductase cytochrome b subunit
VLEHGIETGVIRRLPSGEFIEVHQPLGPVDEHGHGQLAYGGASVPKKMNQVGGARRAVRGFFRPIEEPAEVQRQAELDARGLEAERADRALTGSGRPSEGGRPSDGGRPQDPRD